MGIREQIAARQVELTTLQIKIDGCEAGPVRVGLKKRRAALTGEIVNLRQLLIAEEIESDAPKHVPRTGFEFSRNVIQRRTE